MPAASRKARSDYGVGQRWGVLLKTLSMMTSTDLDRLVGGTSAARVVAGEDVMVSTLKRYVAVFGATQRDRAALMTWLVYGVGDRDAVLATAALAYLTRLKADIEMMAKGAQK